MRKCVFILVFALAAGVLSAAQEKAAHFFEAARKAEKAGDTLKAYLLYARAAQLDPANPTYAARKSVLGLSAALNRPAELGPDPAEETVEAQLKTEGLINEVERQSAPPPRLAPVPGTQSFDITGDARKIFQQVAGAFGIKVLFDPGYESPSPSINFRIGNSTAPEAIRAAEIATDSFVAPLGARLALVARDTPQKRAEFMPDVSLAVPIPERLSIQEAQEITTGVQQTLEIRRISLDSAKRVIYFRDSMAKALAAREIFLGLARARGQVELDIDLISVADTSSLSYGLALPTSFNIVDFGTALHNVPQLAATAANFFTFGGGSTFLGIGIGQATVFATLSKSSSENLLSSRIVTLDGQPAGLLVGEKYPIVTGNFTDITGAVAQGNLLAPSVNFEDLGLVLKVTPVVHANAEVTLDLDASFKTLGAASVDGIPIIENRQFQGKVRLREGESAVVAGLVSTADIETRAGFWGLSDLPVIGPLFTHKTREKDTSQVLVVIRPHLTNPPAWESVSPEIWTGSETRPVIPE